jgi:hypothetical protein
MVCHLLPTEHTQRHKDDRFYLCVTSKPCLHGNLRTLRLLALRLSQMLRFQDARKRRKRNRPYPYWVVLKCCGKELTKRVLNTLSPVLAQCGLNLPKVLKKNF